MVLGVLVAGDDLVVADLPVQRAGLLVLLGRTGVYAAGTKPKLWFAYRSTDKIEFTARRLDLARIVRDMTKRGQEPWMLRYPAYNWLHELEEGVEEKKEAPSARYVGKPIAQWTEARGTAPTISPTTHLGV